VTAETAVVLPVLVLVLAAAVWAVATVAAQLRCVDAAREAARAAARGEPTAVAVSLARGAAPGADVMLDRQPATVSVVVRLRVGGPGWLGRRLPSQVVSAHAAAAVESRLDPPADAEPTP
jgi:hypothetical protein